MSLRRAALILSVAAIIPACGKKPREAKGVMTSEDGFRGNFDSVFEKSGQQKPVAFPAPMLPPALRPSAKPPPSPRQRKPSGAAPPRRRPVPVAPSAGVAVPEERSPSGSEEPRRPSSSPKDESSRDRDDADRPDDINPGRGAQGSRYLSPARPKGSKTAVAAAGSDAAAKTGALEVRAGPAGSAAPELRGAEVSSMKADLPAMLVDFRDDDGSFRIQLSETEDFAKIMFDKTYPFLDEFDPAVELRRVLPHGGNYWMRTAFIDLLDFQHPFSKPKKYYVRHRDLWGEPRAVERMPPAASAP